MATPPQFRLSLRPDANNYYRVINDVVTVSSVPYYISDPVGWDEVSISNAKNLDLLGMDRDFTVPYQFVEDGAKILRFLDYTTRGSESICKLYVEIRDDDNWNYKPFTPNPLDIAFNDADDQGDRYVAPVKQSGAEAMIRANLDTEYKVPVSANSAKQIITVKPLIAQGEIKWVTDNLTLNYPNINPNTNGEIQDDYDRMIHLIVAKKTFVPTSTGGEYSPVKMGQLTTASTVQLGTPEGQYPTSRSLSGNFNQNNVTGFPYMFRPKVALNTVVVKGAFDVKLTNNEPTPTTINFRVIKLTFPGGGASPVESVMWEGPNRTMAVGDTINFTETILTNPFSMTTNDELIIYYRTNGPKTNGGFFITIEQGRYITATFRYATQQFYFYGLRGRDVFSSLVNQITNNQYPAASDLMSQTTAIIDSIPANIWFTSGLAIRSQNGANALVGGTYIKITLRDFLKAYQCWYNAGLSIESGKVRIERANRYFDKNTLIYDLGTIPDLGCSIQKAQDFQYHTIKAGYPNQTYDEVNGLDEFNTTQNFVNGGVRTTRSLDLISPVRADGWGIFFEWVKYVLEETKDSESDSDTFALECKTDPISFTINGTTYNVYTPVTGGDITSLTGVIDPVNMFNMTLSPKHMILANGGIIRGGNYPFESDVYKFQTTDKNAEMASTRVSGSIVEKADVTVSTLSAPLFYPYVFTLDVPSPSNLLTLLDAKPYGVFRFTWRGQVLEGFCLQASISPAKPNSAQMKLLCSPNVNLQNLHKIL